MSKILVFPAGTEIGLEIFRSLHLVKDIELVGATSVSDHSEFVFSNIRRLPTVFEHDFLGRLSELILQERIDFVFPAHDDVLFELALRREYIDCPVLTSPSATCEIARFKSRTYKALGGIIAVPIVYSDRYSITEFPVFYKPDRGQGSQGAGVARSFRDLELLDESFIVTQYLPGKEYTVDCFTNSKGELLYNRGRERVRTRNGISVSSVFSDHRSAEFGKYAAAINSSVELRGAWFFQVKEDCNGELVLLEFAPRVAGAMAMSRVSGANLPLLTILDALGYPVNIQANDYSVQISRALENRFAINVRFSNAYFDFDDTLEMGGLVVPEALKVLAVLKNRGVRIVCLSRHRGNLGERLRLHGLNAYFSEVHHILDGAPKSRYIDSIDSIFVDDSFAERMEVRRAVGIPTFDLTMLEGII